jgi:hypothetical protein
VFLRNIRARVNYLQDLMIFKAFDNSIEITKALEFIKGMTSLHNTYCEEAKKFIAEQRDILNSFELIEKEKDPMDEIFAKMKYEYELLNQKVIVWLLQVF